MWCVCGVSIVFFAEILAAVDFPDKGISSSGINCTNFLKDCGNEDVKTALSGSGSIVFAISNRTRNSLGHHSSYIFPIIRPVKIKTVSATN